jgi:hypothetical protein
MSPEREVTPETQLVPDLGDEREAALLRNSARGRILERTRQEATRSRSSSVAHSSARTSDLVARPAALYGGIAK